MPEIMLAVESRVVAYVDGVEAPHVFASVSTPIDVPQLDNSPNTVETFLTGIDKNHESLKAGFKLGFEGDGVLDLGQVTNNTIDQNVLRNLLTALDNGKARILQSRFTRRDSSDPTWYCIQVKKL